MKPAKIGDGRRSRGVDSVVDRTNEIPSGDAWLDPTTDFYALILSLYTRVNKELWNSRLPGNVLFAVNTHPCAIGHYAHRRWQRSDGSYAHEIAFHGGYLRADGGLQCLQTLVHECCHLWQYTYGNPGKRGYHNKEFAAEMRRVGLQAVNVGAGPGTETGYRVSDVVIQGGGVDRLYTALMAEGYEVTWAHALQRALAPLDLEQIRRAKRRSKTKYSCQICRLNAWAKPGVRLVCGECSVVLKEDAQ